MIAALNEINSVITDHIDKPMLLGKPSRPHARAKIFEWFRLPQTSERIAQDCLNQIEYLERNTLIRFHPES